MLAVTLRFDPGDLTDAAAKQQDAEAVSFGIQELVVPIELWVGSETNKYDLQGALTLDGRPVEGAIIQVDQYVLSEPTDNDGSFLIRPDQTVLDRSVVSVVDAGNARVDGDILTETQQEMLLAAMTSVATAFDMNFESETALTAGASDVSIAGTLTFADGSTPVPTIAVQGFRLEGTVLDATGSPVSDAVVSLSADGGESWSFSNTTAEDGTYHLRFFPEDDPAMVRVALGAELNQGMEPVAFEVGTSSALDLMVPESGLALLNGDGGETLTPTAEPGAEYFGIFCNIAVDGTPLDAVVTWPDEEGHFTITIPSAPSSGTAAFYQVRERFFSADEIVPGGDVPPTVVGEPISDSSPQGLQPFEIE